MVVVRKVDSVVDSVSVLWCRWVGGRWFSVI